MISCVRAADRLQQETGRRQRRALDPGRTNDMPDANCQHKQQHSPGSHNTQASREMAQQPRQPPADHRRVIVIAARRMFAPPLKYASSPVIGKVAAGQKRKTHRANSPDAAPRPILSFHLQSGTRINVRRQQGAGRAPWASSSSTATESSQPIQASVMLCPYSSGFFRRKVLPPSTR